MIFKRNEDKPPVGLLGQAMARQQEADKKQKHSWPEKILMALCLLIILGSIGYIIIRPRNLGSYLPGLIGLFFFLLAYHRQWLAKKTKRGVGRLVKNVFIVGMACFLLSFAVLCGTIFAVSQNVPEEGADAVIVLGAGLAGGERVSHTLSLRLNEAARYLRANEDTIVVTSGGQGADEKIPEALAMKDYLAAIGIAEERIIMEDLSTSTDENFRFSKALLDEHFGTEDYTVVYVTNDFHLLRSGLYAKRAGLDAEGLASHSPFYLLPSFYTREYCGLLMYGFQTLIH